jgi:hypothetical protein
VKYATRTRVPTDRSRMEIERTLERFGATSFAYATKRDRALVGFELKDRRVRMSIRLIAPEQLPQPARHGKTSATERAAAANREQWRALLLCIKSKLVAITAGIETVEQAFMAHLVLPNGKTMHEQYGPEIAQLGTGKGLPLLPEGEPQ